MAACRVTHGVYRSRRPLREPKTSRSPWPSPQRPALTHARPRPESGGFAGAPRPTQKRPYSAASYPEGATTRLCVSPSTTGGGSPPEPPIRRGIEAPFRVRADKTWCSALPFGILELRMKREASGNAARRPSPVAPSIDRTRRVTAPRGALRLGPSARDLVIVSRALADLGDFLQRRQESTGRGRVLLDRRLAERRRALHTVEQDLRQSDRRRPPSDPTQALMRVLGFMVVPSDMRPARSAAGRDVKRTAGARGARARSRQAASGHRARRRRS